MGIIADGNSIEANLSAWHWETIEKLTEKVARSGTVWAHELDRRLRREDK